MPLPTNDNDASLLDDYEARIDPRTPNEERDDYQVSVKRGDIRALEASNREGREAKREAERLQRENLALRAGVDLDSDKGKLFVNGYDGELDLDKVKAAAIATGTVAAPPADDDGDDEPGPSDEPEETPLEEGEADLQADRRTLASNSPADTPPPADPYEEAEALHDKVKADGGLAKEAVGSALNSIVNAAHRGDKRVILPSRSVQTIQQS